MVPVGKALYEFVGTGRPAGCPAFFFRGILISPPQVLQNRTGKQYIFLQNHCHGVPERFQIIFPHIPASHIYATAIHIIETADQIYQAGLAASRTAYDANGFAGPDMELYIGQRLPGSALISSLIHSPCILLTHPIGKTYTVKINASVRHIHGREFRAAYARFFLKYLFNSPYAGSAHGNHDKYHGQHHKRHHA